MAQNSVIFIVLGLNRPQRYSITITIFQKCRIIFLNLLLDRFLHKLQDYH